MTIENSTQQDLAEIERLYTHARDLQAYLKRVVWPSFSRKMIVQELEEGKQFKLVVDGPLKEHLKDLCNAVVEHQADFGIAVDPDVDRLVFVDEKGELFGGRYVKHIHTSLSSLKIVFFRTNK